MRFANTVAVFYCSIADTVANFYRSIADTVANFDHMIVIQWTWANYCHHHLDCSTRRDIPTICICVYI